ncbi:MAG: DUF1292 domain-containing protein [Cyanobacteria bacterium P01_H01_bin.74]
MTSTHDSDATDNAGGSQSEIDALDTILSDNTIIETTDEEGEVHVFEKVSEFEFENTDYALLIYRGAPEDLSDQQSEASVSEEEEVVVMRVALEDGQEVFEAIEDEEEFSRVVAFLDAMDEDDIEVNVGDVLSQMAENAKTEQSD